MFIEKMLVIIKLSSTSDIVQVFGTIISTLYNKIPTVFIGENGAPSHEKDIAVSPREAPLLGISYLLCHLNPISYPLLFPCGDFRMYHEIYQNEEFRMHDRKKVTLQQFYNYFLAIHEGFSIIHRAGKLFQ